MKTYTEHLASTATAPVPSGRREAQTRKPVFRSSAIFPVLHSDAMTTRILALGYWLLKREIREVSLLVTLRGADGSVLHRVSSVIDEARAYAFELAELLTEAGVEPEGEFTGSVECEIFASRDLVYPYPAIVLVYHGRGYNTAVHTAGRIFNDHDDRIANESIAVPEAGFDIHAGEGWQPFVAFVNGPDVDLSATVDYALYNSRSETRHGTLEIGDVAAYGTVFIDLSQVHDLDTFLGGESGTVKIRHDFKGFFPRFVAGNRRVEKPSASITHTYYDCVDCDSESDYWNVRDERFHQSAIFVPVFGEDGCSTELIFYPIYSPADFELALEFYDEAGNRLGDQSGCVPMDTRRQQFQSLSLLDAAQNAGVDPGRVKGANIVLATPAGKPIPSRLKFGLNVGRDAGAALPCNICFSAHVANPAVLAKPGTFRWAPFLNQGDSSVVFTNASALKEHDRAANVVFTFHREQDTATIQRRITVPPFGQVRFELEKDEELRAHFASRPGWVTARSDSPFLNGWYFDFHAGGAVAGDHCF